MEKKVYELKINETLEHVMPPLQEMELKLLTESLLTEGCRDPLTVWNGTIIDGHNRYRVCRENDIPFNYVEMEFENQGEAIAWMIKNQIAHRNLTPFQKCEMVLPFEAELKADAKKRQGWRSDIKHNVYGRGRTTADILADMAGVSHGTLSKAKTVLDLGDEETLRRVRKGEISIHFAYSTLVAKPPKFSPVKEEDTDASSEDIAVDITPAPVLQPIGDAVRDLLSRVTEGEATTKMIIAELENVARMIDEASSC